MNKPIEYYNFIKIRIIISIQSNVFTFLSCLVFRVRKWFEISFAKNFRLKKNNLLITNNNKIWNPEVNFHRNRYTISYDILNSFLRD